MADLLSRHPLVGMTQQEVFALLGEETPRANGQTSFKMSKAYFAPEDTLVYYLGVDYMDSRWLILPLEGGVVTACHIDVT